MRKMQELNGLERRGAKEILKNIGFTPCSIGIEGRKGWSFKGITLEEADVWFHEEE